MIKKRDISSNTFAGIEMPDAFLNRFFEWFYEPSPWQTDEMIEEVLPKYQFYIRVPYIRFDSDRQEVRIGLHYVVLFSWGKKKVQRRAYIWESKKKTGGVLKIKSYGQLKTTA